MATAPFSTLGPCCWSLMDAGGEDLEDEAEAGDGSRMIGTIGRGAEEDTSEAVGC